MTNALRGRSEDVRGYKPPPCALRSWLRRARAPGWLVGGAFAAPAASLAAASVVRPILLGFPGALHGCSQGCACGGSSRAFALPASLPPPAVGCKRCFLSARAPGTLTRVGRTAPILHPARCLRACWARFVMGPQPAPILFAVARARHKSPLPLCAPPSGRATNHDLKSPGKPVDVWSLLYIILLYMRPHFCLCFLVGGIPPPPAA